MKKYIVTLENEKGTKTAYIIEAKNFDAARNLASGVAVENESRIVSVSELIPDNSIATGEETSNNVAEVYMS